tara:strand:- start:2607 stop:3581 length:975 start_codon:yes stop_codon:yes gene_type:complete
MGGGGYNDQWIKDAEARLSQNVADLGLYNEHRWQENVAQNEQLANLGSATENLASANTAQDEALEAMRGIDTTQSTQIEDLFGASEQFGIDISDLRKDLGDLETLYGDGVTSIEDVTGLEDVIDGLKDKYATDERLTSSLTDLETTLRGDFEAKVQALPDYTDQLNQVSSDYNLTKDQLNQLRSSFGDFQQQSATNLSDVQSALQTEIGDVRGNLTSGLKDLRTDAFDALTDVYSSRDEALSDLSGRFGTHLRQQEDALTKRIDDTGKDVENRIAQLGSMMNYRMLGDSAGGVKMRRSKAFTSGAVNTGTGQLSRSMKLKTLNI